MTAPSRLLKTSTFRLLLVYLGLFALTGAAVVGTIYWRTNELVTRQVLQVIAAEATGLREQFQLGSIALLAEVVRERAREGGQSLYFLSDASGRRLAGNLGRLPPELGEETAGGLFRYRRLGEEETEPRWAVGVPIAVPGGGLLVVARDVEETRALARSARRIFVLGFGLLSIVGLAGAVLVARNMTRRIDAVTGASRRIMQGALAERLPLEGSGDEIDRLSASVNEMLERIEQLMAGLREVSDNIAHDLKTPLTRLRSRAETALREAHGEARLREGLERVIEDADGIIKTFNALLSIARLEAGAGAERRERVDLCEVLRDAAELYEPVAEEAGLAIRLAGEAGIVARADRQLIGQAVANLIDNAIKHGADEVGHVGASAASGKRDAERHTIVVALSLREGLAEIAVADRGPGIPAADRERALKRFVRLEASRTRPGTGLGLSLVAAVARQHGGTVRLEDNHPGLRVVLSLPAEAAPPAKPLERDAAAQTMPAAPARRPELTVGTDS